jgi:cell division septation protein DedD
VIDRTFEIPVTYPYKIAEEILVQTPDSLIINPAVFIVRQTSPTDNSANAESIPLSDNEIVTKLVRVQENIYKRGSEYGVQVSSWKSKLKAEKELKKYIDNGFHAELIEESTSDLGKYRKVIVCGFNSIEEAKNFLIKNK